MNMDRFTICLPKGLLNKLDEICRERSYPSRSRAIADFIRRASLRRDWRFGKKCAGVISIVYNIRNLKLQFKINNVLANNSKNILSAQTVIIDGGKIFLTISAAGNPKQLESLADSLRALKGVTHGSFSIAAPI